MDSGLVHGTDDPAEPEPGPPGVDMDKLEQLAEG